MPRYLSQHPLACLTRQGAETLAQCTQGGATAFSEFDQDADITCSAPPHSREVRPLAVAASILQLRTVTVPILARFPGILYVSTTALLFE